MRKGSALFIVHDVYQDDNDFPLGPAYMAAMLRKNGFDVQVYCQDIFHFSNDELADYLEGCEFDIIGIGFMAARFKETVESLCGVVRKHKKNAWLVLGGPGPSPIPEYILQKTQADIIAIGEAEETIIELLNCKIEKGSLTKVKGIAYMQDGKVIINHRRLPIKKLDSIPFPEWSLFPMKEYTSCLQPFNASKDDVVFGMVTSRGCVNKCSFCYRMEKGIRLRNINNIVEEIKILNDKYGVNYFMMYDELFVVNKSRMNEFKKALKQNNLKIKFYCNARVDMLDRELVELLKECGCIFLNFGMESSDQRVLDLMNKRTTVEQNIIAAEISKEAGIGLGLNFIWGNLGDSAESLKNNVDLIKKYNTYDQLRTIRPVTPYPGSELYYTAIEMDLLKGPEDFFDKFRNSDLFTVNFTDIPKDEYYKLLFNANKELILDHYHHTNGNMEEAENLISSFFELYFKGNCRFRGARHYKSEN